MLAERIKMARNFRGIKQITLSKLVNISTPTIIRYESGEREPKASDLLKIAEALDTSVAYLMGEIDDPSPLNGAVIIEKTPVAAIEIAQSQPADVRVTIEDLPAKVMVGLLCERIKKEAPTMDDKTRIRVQDDLAECQRHMEGDIQEHLTA